MLAFSDVVLPEGAGGVERTIEEIYPRIAANGAHIEMIALSSSRPGVERREDGLTVRRVRRIGLERLTGLQVAFSFEVWAEAFRRTRRLRPDVIHAHTLFFLSTLAAAIVATVFRVPLVLTMHVGRMDALPRRQRLLVRAYERTAGWLVLRLARCVICVSADVAEHARALGAPRRKVVVIPNGVDFGKFEVARDPETPPLVLCVGRLILNKGPMDLVEAAWLLAGRGLAFRVAFAGSGPLEAALRRQVEAHRLGAVVEFLGDREDIPDLLARAAVFVRPSLTDGMSLALLEAMAAGVPVVATRISGAEELLSDGESGRLVPPGQPGALANAIAEVLAAPEDAAAMADRGRQVAAGYTWESVARKTREVLCNAAR